VLPLYGRLSAADQHRVFETKRAAGVRRRVVLATNVAETSLTVPGIKYVIDAGTARISRYSVRAKVQRLPIEAISQASANQRSGRAGRTSDGIAIRLYSEEDFDKRPAFTDPEILRTNLAAVILQMISIGLGDIAAFPFLQPPDSRGIQDGMDLLLELNAISRDRTTGHTRITKVGRDLAALPLDPRFGRMLVEAKRNGVVREVAAIVAGLSIQDVRERPLEKRAQADQLHARFADPTSDFLGLLTLWNYLEEQQKELSSSAFRRLCKGEFLNYLRIREWHDLYRTLERGARSISGPRRDASADARLGRRADSSQVDPDGIHKSLLAGLLSRIGLRDERVTKSNPKEKPREGREPKSREYLGARNQKFAIFPGSTLARKGPPAVMAAELVETSRLFARTVAAIDPAWAEALAGDLVKRSYGEPRWEKRQGSAVADEKVTLYGVPIVPKRRIQLARIDPDQARELFIRHAMVDGDWPYAIERNGLFEFARANAALRDELSEVEERTRRRDILIDDEVVVDFYERRIPRDVTDVRRFETWWKAVRSETPGLLTMTRGELLEEEADDGLDADAFPGEWQQGEQRLPLRYRFEPGADDDGVTLEIPLALLAHLEDRGFDWLVPGLREELVTALLKTLPKAIRRNVVPAADWARRLLGEIPPIEPVGSTPLTEYLADRIRRDTYTVVSATDFDSERLPPHLRMTFAAVDERGARVATSTSLVALQHRLAERSRQSVAKLTGASAPRGVPGVPGVPAPSLERSGLTTWDVDTLPRKLETAISSGSITGYPALVDEGSTVAIRVFGTAADQAREHPRGVRRLIALTVPSPLSYVQEHLTATEKLQLATSPYRSTAALFDDALLATIDQLADAAAARFDGGHPFTRAEFETLRAEVNGKLVDALFATVSLGARALGAAREADRAIAGAASLSLMAPLADARAQLAALVHPGFLRITGVTQLRRVPVYLAGITHRVGKLADAPGRDRVWLTELEQATALYTDAGGTLPLTVTTPARLVPVRWMLEELRLSLFAQQLGTAGTVSIQRIRKALA
jgi:ATP-dependent helicase HrpA